MNLFQQVDRINHLLANTHLTISEIAAMVGCSVDLVNQIVDVRFDAAVARSEAANWTTRQLALDL